MKQLIKLCLLLSMIVGYAQAAILQVNTNGLLTGVAGVNVNGNIYDVSFLDGTCAFAYGICNKSNFQFDNNFEAAAANTALISQSFVIEPNGTAQYSGLIAGCNPVIWTGMCQLNTAYAAYSQFNYVEAAAGYVYINGASGVYTNNTNGFHMTDDLSTMNLGNQYVWAVWSPSISSDVPEPSILAILGIGMLLMVATRRRNRSV